MKKDENLESIRISAIGILDITLHLTLRPTDIEKNNIDISSINTTEDLGNLLYDKEEPRKDLIDLITLSSNSFLINILLWINRAFKQKTFIELITLNEMIFTSKRSFLKRLIKTVTEKNLIFLIENPLQDIHPNIVFVLKLLQKNNDNIIQEKKFNLFERNCIIMNQNDNHRNHKGVFEFLSYNFHSDFFLSDFSELIKLKSKSFPDFDTFFATLIQNFPKLKFITNFSSGILNKSSSLDILDTIKTVISYSDLIFFEKDEMIKFYCIYNEIYSHNYDKNKLPIIFDKEKKRKNIPRISVIIDKLESVHVVNQVGVNLSEEYNNEYIFSFNKTSDNNELSEYNKLIIRKYLTFKSIFIGSFLSRIIYGKCFNTCFTAGNLSIKNMLDIVRFNIDYITNLKYYQVVVPVNLKKNILSNKTSCFLKHKENGFVLDCIPSALQKKKEYNSLFDKSCQSFYLSNKNKAFLTKAGFINKNGVVLKDPGFLNIPKNKNDRLKLMVQISNKNDFILTNTSLRKTHTNTSPYFYSKKKSKSLNKQIILPPLYHTNNNFYNS